jgi:hypothetical protein
LAVPAIKPLNALRLSPVGSCPAVIDQVRGGAPPVADNCCEYDAPNDVPGSAPVVIVNGAGSIVIAKLRLAVVDELSVTVAVNV